MTPMDKCSILDLEKEGQHQSFESREHSRPSNTEEWQSMNAVVTEEHRATSEIDLGDQNLARMHSLDLETNELKLRRTFCLDSSFVPEVPEHTSTLSKTERKTPLSVSKGWMQVNNEAA